MQSKMLEDTDNLLNSNLDRIQKVNGRMKETLEEVGRASDKIIVDIMCIVLAIGFGAVIYNYVA